MFSFPEPANTVSVNDLHANLTFGGQGHDLTFSDEELLLPAISSSVVNGNKSPIVSTSSQRRRFGEKISPHTVLGKFKYCFATFFSYISWSILKVK